MEWSEERIVTLIEQYRLHPNLWNPNDPYYKKSDMKKDALNEIGAMLNVDSVEIERKLNVILAQYRKARAKAIKMKKFGMGFDQIKEQVWFGFKYLGFLRDRHFPKPIPRVTIKKKDTTEDDDFDKSGESEIDDKIRVHKDDNHKLGFDNEPIRLRKMQFTKRFKLSNKVNSVKSVTKKTKKSRDDNTQINNTKNLSKEVDLTHSQPKDDCLLFAELMTAKLKKFDPVARACAEKQIYKIVTDMEMRILLAQQEGNNEHIYTTMPPSPLVHSISSSVSPASEMETSMPSPVIENTNLE